MAKSPWMTILIVAIVAWLLFPDIFSNIGGIFGQKDTEDKTDGLGSLIDGTLELSGNRMFLEGTSLAGRGVRVFNDGFDEGTQIIGTDTVTASPGDELKIYFYENDTGTSYCLGTCYYTLPIYEEYPLKEIYKLKGTGCQMDTAPTTVTFDEYGQVQTASANAQAIAANDEKTVSVRVKPNADKCLGNPEASEDNTICFKYLSTSSGYQSVEANTGSQSLPYNISSAQSATGYDISCYKLNKLVDLAFQDVQVTIKSGSTNPGTVNITVWIDDIAFDINADTNEEIWDFQDEDNNPLGINPVTDVIYTS